MRTPIPTGDSFLNRRRDALSQHPTLMGLDYIEVLDLKRDRRKFRLELYFVPATLKDKEAIPHSIGPENIRIAAETAALTRIRVVDILDPIEETSVQPIHIEVEEGVLAELSEQSYTLRLINVQNLDPFFARATFSLKLDEPSEFDCRPALRPATEPLSVPEIDYLAKDYTSFRRLLLDRLSVVMPQWKERNPADLGLALVETLAYAADHLSYYQDAVATEAYLGTARRRTSVRRHARLVDYAMHEGCNARVWVQVQVEDGMTGVALGEGTQLLTRLAGQPLHIPPSSSIYDQALAQGPEVFETAHPAELRPEHNEIPFYTWGADEFSLPKGATGATLKDERTDGEGNKLRRLQAGDVLIFEEVKGPVTGDEADADPVHRHAVRLTRVTFSEDPLGGQFLESSSEDAMLIAEIEWHAQDALPFPLCISALSDGRRIENVSVARGNVVLADHGRTIAEEELLPAVAPESGRYRPRLQRTDVTHGVPYDHDLASCRGANAVVNQDPRAARPFVTLQGNEDWSPRRDLLRSDRFARDFVVEMESDGRACLRFGDGVMGRRPTAGSHLLATYRIGNGLEGNIGSDTIAHVVTADKGICGVRNPLPAQGGIDPEPIEQVRLYAPQAFRTQERAVTTSDYAAAAQRHPEVRRAGATLRWTGSWNTVFVTVDREGGRPVDEVFKAELIAFLERFRLAGYDLAIEAPRLVGLDIALTVCVEPGHLRNVVEQRLLETFSDADLPDGRRGFFHPDNFTFGQPVYLSQIVAQAMQVPGAGWVTVERFQRRGQPPRGELEAGRIDLARLEIARLDNDASAPENGKIEFYMEGGR